MLANRIRFVIVSLPVAYAMRIACQCLKYEQNMDRTPRVT